VFDFFVVRPVSLAAPDDDGLRGDIFATDDNSTIVLSIKSTSAQ
jgi:putative lipase involved disintegration of autophagic bodies